MYSNIAIMAVSAVLLFLSVSFAVSNQSVDQALGVFFNLSSELSDEDRADILEVLDTYEGTPVSPEDDAVVQNIVRDIIREYDLDKEGTISRINSLNSTVDEYPFIVDFYKQEVVAHGALRERIGATSLIFSNQTDTLSTDAIAKLESAEGVGGGIWIEYLFLDINLDTDQVKRSWLVLHDGYVFGAGYYYSVELRVKHEVAKAVFLYDLKKEKAFSYISSLAQTPYPYYVSVVNIKSAEVVAHGAFPEETIGNRVTNSRQGLSDLEQGDTFWLYIQNKNPMTGLTDQKRVWSVRHDGYIFGAGYYYYAEEKARFIVNEVIELYDQSKETAFNHVDSMRSSEPHYPFVLDPDTGHIASHGAFPHLIGSDSVILTDRTERLTVDILEDLQNDGIAWTDYIFQNPRTGEQEHKRSYLQLHDGYIFGSGFYYTVFGVPG